MITYHTENRRENGPGYHHVGVDSEPKHHLKVVIETPHP